MIKKSTKDISYLFHGKQGIKQVYHGKNKVYERDGGYIYITLESDKKE